MSQLIVLITRLFLVIVPKHSRSMPAKRQEFCGNAARRLSANFRLHAFVLIHDRFWASLVKGKRSLGTPERGDLLAPTRSPGVRTPSKCTRCYRVDFYGIDSLSPTCSHSRAIFHTRFEYGLSAVSQRPLLCPRVLC